jgi:hypothetical protein
MKNRIKSKKMKLFLVPILAGFALIAFTGTAFSDVIRSIDVNFHTGFHMMTESKKWLDTETSTIQNDMLIINDPYYISTDASSKAKNGRTGMLMLGMEFLVGVNLHDIPFLKKYEKLKKINGLRVGLGMNIYPFTSMKKSVYSGPITYDNSLNPGPGDASYIQYTGSISVEERMFIVAPSLNIYYFHEEGFKVPFCTIVPFGGVELGLGILNGERKYELRTSPWDAGPTGNNKVYHAEGNIQENFFNAIGIRVGGVIGGEFRITQLHAVDFRIGFVYEEVEVPMGRAGAWTENINGYPYSKKLASEKVTATYSQTGIYFTLGYTVRIR